jgi:hypothetical protein
MRTLLYHRVCTVFCGLLVCVNHRQMEANGRCCKQPHWIALPIELAAASTRFPATLSTAMNWTTFHRALGKEPEHDLTPHGLEVILCINKELAQSKQQPQAPDQRRREPIDAGLKILFTN